MAIRNTTTDAARQVPPIAMPLQAIVLRGVYWANYRDDERQWLKHLIGTTTERDDGSIVHHPMAQQLTTHAFETGLILPGEEMIVTAPITPQGNGRHDLVVSYAVVGGTKDWTSEVLLPEKGAASPLKIYSPAKPEQVRERRGVGGGYAIVRSTSKVGASSLPIRTMTIPLQLPLANDPKKTGGLSDEEAARRAGIDVAREKYLAFYREAMRSWFFVRSDRRAVALSSELPLKAPPGSYRQGLDAPDFALIFRADDFFD